MNESFNLKVQLDRFPPNCPKKLYAKVWCQTHLNRFFYCFFSLIPLLKWTVQAERDRWTVRLNRWTSAILEFSYFGLQRRSRKLWQKAKRETIIGMDRTNRLTKKLSEQLIAKEKLRKWFIWKMKNIFIKFSSQKSGPAFSSTGHLAKCSKVVPFQSLWFSLQFVVQTLYMASRMGRLILQM